MIKLSAQNFRLSLILDDMLKAKRSSSDVKSFTEKYCSWAELLHVEIWGLLVIILCTQIWHESSVEVYTYILGLLVHKLKTLLGNFSDSDQICEVLWG